VPAAIGEPAGCLHVHVLQIARILPLVGDGFGFARRQTGVQFDVAQQ